MAIPRLHAPMAALLLGVIALFILWPREEPIAREPVEGRLPPIAVPDRYLLRLSLFPDQPIFRGEVEIDLQLHTNTQSLYLHGRDLSVTRVELRRAGKDPVHGRYQQLSPQGLARVDLEEAVKAGFVTLVLHYDGKYTNTAEGLSRTQVDGRWYVFSQFHPIDARRVFPSFDEPRFKATFDVEIISWRDDAVIGNGLPSETRQLPNNMKLTRLSRTPRLATYLLNISVGPFDVVNGPSIPANEVRHQPLTLRAVTLHGEGVRTRFALDHSAAMLTAFEQYFAIPFPFEKLDLLAVPDSSSNVLENAGAINFRDQMMLIDEHASVDDRQNFIAHHAHGLAHQWFGNLVTMPWWDELWLNEGFAEWLGYKIAAESHPDYPLASAMQQQLEHAISRDGLSPQMRIRQPINREQDVQSTINSVVYDKAMGLMRMYEHYLGDERFRTGLRNYFARHAFGNAGSPELLQSLSDAVADPDISNSFDSFLNQSGLPEIELTHQCIKNDLQITLRQRAYQPAGSALTEQSWQLPVCLRTLGQSMIDHATSTAAANTNPQSCRMLKQREVIWSPGWHCNQMVLPNAGGAGYYHWQLSAEHRHNLLNRLSDLPLAEALDTVANLNAALQAGKLTIEEYWQSLPAIARYPDPAALDTALAGWRYVLQQLLQPPASTLWLNRLQTFFASPVMAANRSETVRQFRALVLRDETLRKTLIAQLAPRLAPLRRGDRLPLPVDSLALAVAIDDDQHLLTPMQRLLERETQIDVRAAVIQALSWQQNPSLLPALQNLLLSSTLRVHERWRLLKATLTAPTLAVAQWHWLQQHAAEVLALLPEYRHSQLPELAETLCDTNAWQQTQRFLQQHANTFAIQDSSVASADSHVRQCIALRTVMSAQPPTNGPILSE